MSKQLHLSCKRLALLFSLFLGSVTTMFGNSESITVDGLNYIFYYSGSGDDAQGEYAAVDKNNGYSGVANIHSSISYEYEYTVIVGYNNYGRPIHETRTRILIANVTHIGGFSGCTGLTSVNIPNTVTTIDADAFVGCTSLTSINIPNSVTTIEGGSFSGCISLTSVNIPNSVTRIGDKGDYCNGVFYGCTSLTNISLPNSLKVIGRCSFFECTGLSSITIPNSVTFIGDYAFSNCI